MLRKVERESALSNKFATVARFSSNLKTCHASCAASCTLQTCLSITRDFVRLHSTFARLYNAATSPASHLRSDGKHSEVNVA